MTHAVPLRVFLSFDCEHDLDLHERLLAEAAGRDSFAISDHSEDGAITGPWTDRARERISASDEVVVICGEYSDRSSRMSAELRIAQEMKKPYVLLWGRRGCMCKKPKSARSADGMYVWALEILEDQLISSMSWRQRARREAPAPLPRG
jgi:hypothetical protein